ncbi:MAG: site-2 protease family protein [Myxococcota bacterium]
MKWSWKLGRFFGIDAYVHASFLLLVAWAAWAAYQGAGTGLAALLGVVFLVGVFGSVLLHEFGHALTARRFGISTRRIVLWPMGGVAQLEGDPRTPRQELLIALAGPAVNFALAAGLFAVSSLFGLAEYGLLQSLIFANVTLGVFNLLPAFPMDGGRVLRAALATRMGGSRATEIAVKIGKGAAVLFGIAGLFGNPMLLLVAAFVWFAASAEGRRNPYARPNHVEAPWWRWSPPAHRRGNTTHRRTELYTDPRAPQRVIFIVR